MLPVATSLPRRLAVVPLGGLVAFAVVLAIPMPAAAQRCEFDDFMSFMMYAVQQHQAARLVHAAVPSEGGLLGKALDIVAKKGVDKVEDATRDTLEGCTEYVDTFIREGVQGLVTTADPLKLAAAEVALAKLFKEEPEVLAAINEARVWIATL